MWSILTLGGYVTSKLKNAFGLRSMLIKNKLNRIEEILQKGLQHLTAVFPTQRVIQSVVDSNDHLKKVKEMSAANKNNQVGINTYSTLAQLMFEIDKAILIYEDDKDLNLMKEEIEELCQKTINNEKINLPNVEAFKKQVKDRTKDLKLNKKLVQELTQKLPRYDLKNLALEASMLIKHSSEGNDHRLAILFQKRKNAIYSKYEKYFDFDELNNWLDYDRFDPSAVKYKEQLDASKKQASSIIKNNRVSEATTMQDFRPKVGSKYYFFFDEQYEIRSIYAELVAIDQETGTQMYKPFGMYQVKKSDKYEFKKMGRKDFKNSVFANVEFIDTNMYIVQGNKMFFAKDEAFFSKSEKTFKFKEAQNDAAVQEIAFKMNALKGFGIFKVDDGVKDDAIDTDNWKKYELKDFQTGLNAIKELLKTVLKNEKPKPTTPSEKTAPVEEPKKSNNELNKEYVKSIRSKLLEDLTSVGKNMGVKKDIGLYVDEFLTDLVKQTGDYKIGKDYEKILKTATTFLFKKKK